MRINTKYSISDTVYILDDNNSIFKAKITGFEIIWVEWLPNIISYSLNINSPVGLNRTIEIEWSDFKEEQIFSSKREAEQQIKVREKELDDKEKRREEYLKLKAEFE